MELRNKSILLILFLFCSFIYIINLWFTSSGFFLFFVTAFLFILFIFKKIPVGRMDYFTLLAFTFLLCSILSFNLEASDVNGLLSIAMWINRFLMLSAVFLALTYFINPPARGFFKYIFQKRYILLLVVSLLIQLTLLKVVKVPDVDIYRIVRYGPLHLISGQNPYLSPGTDQTRNESSYHYQFYTYGPASLFLFLPSDLLGDPRYLLIVCNFLVAFSLYKISRSHSGQTEAELLSLIFLFHPRYPNLLVNSVTDVLIVGLLAYAFISYFYKRYYQFGIGLGLLVGVKVLYGIPLLFLFKLRRLNKVFIISGLATALLAYIPFLLANSSAFLGSVLLFHISQQYTLYLQESVVTLASFAHRQWNYFPQPYVFPLINIFLVITLWIFIKPVQKFSEVLTVISFVFLISLFFSQQALPGYYFVASAFLLFAIAFE